MREISGAFYEKRCSIMLFEHVECDDLIDHLMECHQDGADDRIVLMEECAELTEAIARTFRPDRVVNTEHVAEEMAHVLTMINMVALHLGVTPEMVQKEIDKKRRKHGLI